MTETFTARLVIPSGPPEFRGLPKIPRLLDPVHDGSPAMVVTEKIDGTNGCVVVTPEGDVFAQSRNRFLTPKDDNFGFALWVHSVSEWLAETLGPGRHYGEWWGQGIQRGYNQNHKRFSLFNTSRWADVEFDDDVLGVVPVLASASDFSSQGVRDTLRRLGEHGSFASPGFMKPEGVVVFHARSNQLFKQLFESGPKGST